MTTKEILTRLQEKYNRGDLPYHAGSKLVYSYDLLWLIEQAERVQELEEDYEYLSHHYGLETEQNKRYREAFKDIRSEIYDAVAHKKSSLEILEAISKVTLEALESETHA